MAKVNTVKKTSNKNSHRVYINGNTARQINNNPKRKGEQKKQFTVITNPNPRQGVNSIGIKSLISSAMFGIAVFSLAIFHLNLQASITASMTTLKKLETQCADLEKENKDRYRDILANVNLLDIKNVALNDYGMVYANQSQMKVLDKINSSYVTQYSEIPNY